MRLTAATQITLARLLLVPPFAYCAVQGLYPAALAIFVVAGLSDALDGWVARRFDQRSRLGAILDPAVDKVLVDTAFITLAFHPGRVALPVWLTVLVLARDGLIVSAAALLYVRAKRREFAPSVLGKATTATQITCVSYALAASAFAWGDGLVPALVLATAATTTLSTAGYAYDLLRPRSRGSAKK